MGKKFHRWGEYVVVGALVAYGAFVPISIAGEQVSFLVAFGGLAALGFRHARPRLTPTPFDGAILLHVATVFFSLVGSQFTGPWLEEGYDSWRLLALYTLYAGLRWRPRLVTWVFGATFAVTVIVSLYGVIQHYTGLDLTRSVGVHYSADLVAGLYRPTGTFRMYSTFAFVLSILLPLALALGWEWATSWRARLVIAAGSVPSLLCLGFTQVRAAWLGLAAAVLLMAALRSPRTLAITIASLGVVGGAMFAVSPAVRNKAEVMFDLSYRANSDRVFMWARAIEMAGDAPVTGIGYGRFTKATEWYYDRIEIGSPVRCHAHNQYLHMWAVTGPLGLVAFLWMFTAFFLVAGRTYRAAQGKNRTAAAAALGSMGAVAGFLVASTSQDPYFNGVTFYALVLALSVGTVAARWLAPDEVDEARAGWLDGVLPGLACLAVASTQGVWEGDLGLAGLWEGRGAAPRVAMLLVGSGIVVTIAMSRSAWHKVRRDPLTLAIVAASALVTGGYLLTIHALVPATGQWTLSGPWALAGTLASLTAAFAVRVVHLVRPPVRRLVIVGALAVLGGFVPAVLVASRPAPQVPPTLGVGPRVDVATVNTLRVRTGDLGGDCNATVISSGAVLTHRDCAGGLPRELIVGGERVTCTHLGDLRAAVGAVTLLCRDPKHQRDLLDLSGAGALVLAKLETDAFVALLPEGGVDCHWTGARLDCEQPVPIGTALLDREGRAVAVVAPGADDTLSMAPVGPLLSDDIDADGVPNAADNCPALANPAQEDSDRDWLGDACEPLVGGTFHDGELWAANEAGELWRFRLGEGPGAPLVPVRRVKQVPPPSRWADVWSADLDGDGSLEWMLVAENNPSISVYDSGGRLRASERVSWRARWVDIVGGTLGGPDAAPILAVADDYDSRIRVYRLEGDALIPVAQRSYPAILEGMALGDADGDGLSELIVPLRRQVGGHAAMFLRVEDGELVATRRAVRLLGPAGEELEELVAVTVREAPDHGFVVWDHRGAGYVYRLTDRAVLVGQMSAGTRPIDVVAAGDRFVALPAAGRGGVRVLAPERP